MSVEKKYREKVNLPSEWEWQFVHDLEDFLQGKGFSVSWTRWDVGSEETSASSSRAIAAEFPDPLSHAIYTLAMHTQDRAVSVTFSSWLRVEDIEPTVDIRVEGSDQTQVYGLAEVLRKFAGDWKPSSEGDRWQEPPRSDDQSRQAQTVLAAENLPIWKQAWFWAALSVGVALLAAVVNWITN